MSIDLWAERNKAAEFWLMRRILTLIGLFLLICVAMPVVRCLFELASRGCRPMQFIQFLAVLAFVIWMMRAQSPFAFLCLFGLSLLADLGFFLAPHSRWGSSWPYAAATIVLTTAIVCGFLYMWYRRFACLADSKPPRDLVKEIGEMAKETMKGDPYRQQNIIELAANTKYRLLALNHSNVWKVGLFGDEMLIVANLGWDVRLARREDVKLQDRGNVLLDTDRKVTILVGDRKWNGRVKAEQYARLHDWLEQATVV